jgi:hypothetical protein
MSGEYDVTGVDKRKPSSESSDPESLDSESESESESDSEVIEGGQIMERKVREAAI